MHNSILEKYGTPLPAVETLNGEDVDLSHQQFTGDFDTWKYFDSVVRLSRYLKQHPDVGIHLVDLDGKPTMHFSPPWDPADDHRSAIIKQALGLLVDAGDSIKFLMHHGLIQLKQHPGYARGSFPASKL